MSYLQKHVGFDFFQWNSDHTSGMFQNSSCLLDAPPHVCVLCFSGLYSTISYNML